MLKIPSNLYGREIGFWLNTTGVEKDSIAMADVIKRISFYHLPDFENLKLSEKEIQILSTIDWSLSDNLFLKACCLEKLRHKNKKNRLETTKTSSDTYLDIYEYSIKCNKTDYSYLRRAIYVRDIKSLNDDAFLTKIIEYFKELPIGWMVDVTNLLLRSYSNAQLEILVPYIQNRRQQVISENKFADERTCIDLQLKMHDIDNDTYHLQMALSFESEICFIQSNAEENTIYMNLPILAKNAYNHVYMIRKKNSDDYNRIGKLMQQLCREHSEIISRIGNTRVYNPLISDEDKKEIAECLKTMKYETIDDVFSTLQQIPFPTKDIVQKMRQKHSDAAPFSSMFRLSKINKEGRTIGRENADEGLRVEVHKELRADMLFIIGKVYLQIRNCDDIDLTGEQIFKYLLERKPSFLSNDSIFLLSKGLAFGFADDFVSSAHILTPTLECMLRNFAEYKCGSPAKWHLEIQEDRTLGGILNVIKQNDLIDEEIYFELHCFLEDKIDVNYRNNLLHGLMPVKQIVNDGIYLWWLCIKLLSTLSSE